MTVPGENEALHHHIADLEQSLREAEQRASYYQRLAEQAGIARLKETETLSQLLAERSQIEEELQQHREHLEDLVTQRTTELSRAIEETQQLNIRLQQEIAERKQVEKAIRESEEKFRVLAQNSPDVIMRFDRQFRHLYVNPIVQTQTGIPPQDFIGKTHRDLGFPPELITIWENAIQQVFQSQKAHRIEFKLPNDIWIDWLLFPEFSPQCEVSAVLTTARDITAYKRIEKALRQEILERQRSEEKRRHLETQLRQIQKLEALGRLAGGVAHDFNNILGIMLGQIELLLQDTPEGSSERASLDTVMRAGERAAELIRQILLFSRFQEHHLTATHLPPIIEETLALMQATIPRSILIRPQIQPHCHPILADASQIRQIIVNLCVNAKHAMQEQGGTLEVSLTEAFYTDEEAQKLGLTSGVYLKLMIRDTGHGIPAQIQEHIFEPFFTTKEIGEGSGLGLAVVHGIVTGHSGNITVESDVGHGTTFSMFFPVLEESAVTATPKERHPHDEKGNGHILLVDDEADLVDLYTKGLTKLGYQVTPCFNGDDALNIFLEDPEQFDLVLTDQVMPGLTGIQLSEKLLNIKPDIPIILATGYSESISEQDAADLGLRDFLLKPIQFRTLVPRIRRILK